MNKMLYVNLSRQSDVDLDISGLLDWGRLGINLEHHVANHRGSLHHSKLKAYSLIMINMNGAYQEGFELCGKIRQTIHLPLIIVEDTMAFPIVRKAMQYQVNDYLPSFSPAEEWAQSVISVMQQPSSDEDDVIYRVKEYVGKMLHRNVTLKEVSRAFHFNRSYLGQKFKRHENMSFNEYVLMQRMERAKLLLEETKLKIYEIAVEVGYTEIDWFYKRFKSYTGISANEYRKRNSVTV